METWVKIKETNFRYSVSNYGNVKKEHEVIIRNNNRKQIIKEKIIKPIPNKYGYLKVRCSIENLRVKNIYIHKLVAKYFIENACNKPQVNHKDGNKSNNNSVNLEWVSAKENVMHAWELGLSKSHSLKKIEIDGVVFDSILSASKHLKIDRNTLTQCIKKGYYLNKKYSVVFKGVKYNSLKEASRANKINPKTVQKYGQVEFPIKKIIKII
jgi:hypothetical protein